MTRVVNLLPLCNILLHVFKQSFQARKLGSPDHFGPRFIRKPLRGRVGVRVFQSNASGEKKAPDEVVDLTFALHNADGQKQREQQLVLLEQRAAHIIVDAHGEVIQYVGDADL